MEEANRKQLGWKREMTVAATNLSLENDRFPRDLLRGFRSVPAENGGDINGVGNDDTAIELNLGLSLGGRFGVDKAPGKLKRSSSVLGTVPFLLEKGDSTTASTEGYTVGLSRTTSLPAEMEDEWWRKRKEVSTVRRMEAKRRRCGKEMSNGDYSDGQTASFEMESLITDSKNGFLQSHLVSSGHGSIDSDGGGGIRRGGGGGGSSSSISDLDNKNQQGSANSCVEERSPNFMGGCASQERNNRNHGTEKPNPRETKAYEKGKPQRSEDTGDRKGKGSTAMLDMPCVFTKGGGSNGRRVDGILYKYGKGEEVRIMCICHGSFLTPSEFVKHAGGGDVDHPLRHIVVNTSATFS